MNEVSTPYSVAFYPNATTNPAWIAEFPYNTSYSYVQPVLPGAYSLSGTAGQDAITMYAAGSTPAVTYYCYVTGYVS